jgi:hypothetical protein
VFAAAAIPAAAELTAREIEVGPPSLSVSHEVRQALARAEAWLAAHPGEEPDAADARAPESREAAEALLAEEGLGDLHALAGLVDELAASGESLVFPDGVGESWRALVARKLVLAQKIAPDGTGWWEDPAGEGSDPRAATALAVRILRTAYGLAAPSAAKPE